MLAGDGTSSQGSRRLQGAVGAPCLRTGESMIGSRTLRDTEPIGVTYLSMETAPEPFIPTYRKGQGILAVDFHEERDLPAGISARPISKVPEE